MPTDPTRSKTRRQRVERKLRRKWTDMRGEVRRELTGDSYYRPQNGVSIGRQSAEFREFLDSTLTENVLEPVHTPRQIERGSHWTAPIVREFYEHGINLAHQDLIEAGLPKDHPVVTTPTDAILRNDNPRFGGEGLHHEYLVENYDEIYHDIEDAVRETTKQSYREYRDALRSEATVSETISRINDRLDKVGSTRTDLVARVKLIQVINDAILARYAELAEDPSAVRVGVEIEERPDSESGSDPEVATDGGTVVADHGHGHGDEAIESHAMDPEASRMVFSTAGDDNVCDDCRVMEAKIATVAQVWSGEVERPPLHVNCRCRWRLWDVEEFVISAGIAGLRGAARRLLG